MNFVVYNESLISRVWKDGRFETGIAVTFYDFIFAMLSLASDTASRADP